MFVTRLLVEDTDEYDLWMVVSPLIWTDAKWGMLTVPAGTLTDLASIPRFLRDRKCLDPNGPSRRPAVMHDWLYADGTRGKDMADQFFRDALKSCGVDAATASVFYYAVHWFGDKAWREHRARDAAKRTWPPAS